MSRLYCDQDADNWSVIRWQGAVRSAMRGARGQAFLRELAAALDAMPVRELIASQFLDDNGCACALGVAGAARGLDMRAMDAADAANVLQIAYSMACEIMRHNDEDGPFDECPHARWARVRAWVQANIITAEAGEGACNA